MSVASHPVLGSFRPTISTLEPFSPLRWLTCPGNLDKLRRVARAKYRRDTQEGRVYRGKAAVPVVPRCSRSAKVMRKAAEEAAIDAVVCRFLDSDYGRMGITDDEPARAVFSAVTSVRKAGWRETTDGASRRENRQGIPWSGSAASRGDDPARVVAAVETAPVRYGSAIRREIDRATAREALIGSDREEVCLETGDAAGIGARTDVVVVEGGSAYLECRRMESTAERIGFREEPGVQPATDGGEPVPFRFRQVRRRSGWKMATRKNHYRTEFPPCVVPLVADLG